MSKGISAGHGQNTYRGMVKIAKGATGARTIRSDSLLIGDQCGARSVSGYQELDGPRRHEASTSRIGEDQIFYCLARHVERTPSTSS